MRVVLMIAVFAVAVPDRPDPTPREARTPQEQILGDWMLITNSNVVFTFRITASESVWSVNGKPSPDNGFTASIAIDASTTPGAIDFLPKRGGEKILAIWKVEGDQLTVAFAGSGDTRPTEFAAPARVAQFRRIK